MNPPSPLNAVTQESLDSTSLGLTLPQALDAFSSAILLLSGDRDHRLLWHSAAVSRVLPCVNEEGIAATLKRLDPDLSMILDTLDGQATESTSQNRVDATLGASETSPKLDCSVCRIKPDYIAIELKDSRDQFSHLQSYMEEREKLFTTSRTISVAEMATTLAHELNQPIGTISNILKGVKTRIQKNSTESDDILAALERAIDQSGFAARIISRIRDFTQSRQPRKVECDVFALVQESAELLDWVIDKAGVNVVFQRPEEPIWVNGDPTMLQQVVTNLIRNAVDAMREAEPKNRILSLTVKIKEGDAQIEIADMGHGLSDSAERNLFVPFVTQKSQGMGVGLNICRSFVELHQGRLWLAQNESGGCTAFVVLPIKRSA